MLRAFVGVTARFGGRRAHDELPGRDDDHFGTVLGAFAKAISRLQQLLGRGAEHIGLHLGADVWLYDRVPVPLLLHVRLVQPADQTCNKRKGQYADDGLHAQSAPLRPPAGLVG